MQRTSHRSVTFLVSAPASIIQRHKAKLKIPAGVLGKHIGALKHFSVELQRLSYLIRRLSPKSVRFSGSPIGIDTLSVGINPPFACGSTLFRLGALAPRLSSFVCRPQLNLIAFLNSSAGTSDPRMIFRSSPSVNSSGFLRRFLAVGSETPMTYASFGPSNS